MEPQANRSMMKDKGWLLDLFSVYWGSLWGAVEGNGSKHLKFSEPLCLQVSSAGESWTAPSDLSPCSGPQTGAPQPKWSSITLLLQGSFKDICTLLTLWQSGRRTANFTYYKPGAGSGPCRNPGRVSQGEGEGSRSWAREQGPAGAATWGT